MELLYYNDSIVKNSSQNYREAQKYERFLGRGFEISKKGGEISQIFEKYLPLSEI